jgi:intracellular protease, PfpI family
MKKKILILLENGVEDSEFIYPYYRFQEEGYKVDIAATKGRQQYTGEHGVTFTSDLSVDEVDVNDYDAVIVPGGKAPDRMRLNDVFAEIISDANQKGMVIAAVCHGPQLLISADVVRGRTMTSWPSVRVDLKNAGATVVDQSSVTDGNIVTSRWPADLPDFCAATINLLHKFQGSPSRTSPIPAS